jgi:hypothetical protein
MNTLYRIALITATLLLFTRGVYAQQTAQAGTGIVSGTAQGANNPPQTMTIRFSAPFLSRAVVTGAPYSAEELSDHTQTLADGTHITQKTRISKLFRDSQGRSRIERPMFMGMGTDSEDVMIVEITDPVSGFRYVLDTYNHVAHRFAPPAEKGNGAPSYTQIGRAASYGTNPAPVRSVTSAPAQSNRPEHVTESLGTQVIEGVQVEGTKTTTTFPVGSMGNDRPLVRVIESWHSPDLKITVLSKNSDPRMGESTMRLQNIDRTEPDPGLFRVPPDYQIVDESGDQVEIKFTRP